MGAYPASVSTFTVVGRLWVDEGDGADGDADPDVNPQEGVSVTFTPQLNPKRIRVPGFGLVDIEPVAAVTDADGYVKTLNGEAVVLAYGGDPDITPTGWTWLVSIEATSVVPEDEFSIAGSAGGTVDLSEFASVSPADPGAEVVAWVSARDAAIAAKDDAEAAQAAAETAQAAAEAAQAAAEAVPTSNDAIVAALLEDGGSATRVAANAAIAGEVGVSATSISQVGIPPRKQAVILNPLANPRLAVDATGWTTSGYGTGGAGTSARVEGAGRTPDEAAWVVEFTTPPTGGAVSYIGPYNDRMPVVGGQICGGSIWVHSTVQFAMSYVIAWFTAATGGSPIHYEQTQITVPANTWTRLRGIALAAPASAAYATVYVRLNAAIGYSGTLKVTAAQPSLGIGLKPPRDETDTQTAFSGFGCMWGDSMTQTAHGGGLTVPQHLEAILGTEVLNSGRGGESALGIAIRQGGVQPLVTFVDNDIPASGSETVTVAVEGYFRNDGSWNFYGNIGGTGPFTLTRAITTGIWTATRSASYGGSIVNLIPGGSPLTVATAQDYADFAVIWAGANDIDNGTQAGVFAAIGAMTDRCEMVGQPYVVLSILNQTTAVDGTAGHTFVTEVNATLARRYGARFLDVRQYLIDHGLEVASITPTAGDTTAIANDTIPPSLMYDTIHLNDAGREVVAKYVGQFLAAFVYALAA